MNARRLNNGELITHGVIGGIIAGIVLSLFNVVMTALVMGGPITPALAGSGTLVLGPQALDPSYPQEQAIAVGVTVHLLLSAIYGVVFVYLLAMARQLGASTGMLLLYGLIYGLVIWAINSLAIAPSAFPWMAGGPVWPGIISHAIFFGLPLAGYVAAARPGRTEVPST